MKTHDPQNERIKRAYFTYLTEAKGFSEATLDGVAKALNRFETYTKFRDFKAFHIEQAKGFKGAPCGTVEPAAHQGTAAAAWQFLGTTEACRYRVDCMREAPRTHFRKIPKFFLAVHEGSPNEAT